MSISENPLTASLNLQLHLNLMSDWYDKWRIKINQSKSIHTTFTLKLGECSTVTLNIFIPTCHTVKYLGFNLNKRLTQNNHLRTKKLTLNYRMRIFRSLLYKYNNTNLKIKLLIYKISLKPIWTYGIQLWGSAKKSNKNKIHAFQNSFSMTFQCTTICLKPNPT